MDKKDITYLCILFIIAFALWTIPARVNEYPYGEGDAAHQYGEADWRAINDTAQRAYPEFLARWYGLNQDDYYAPGNAAPFAINAAFVQQLSGQRFLPKTIFLVFIGIVPLMFAVFLLIKELYDSDTAFISSLLLIFSMKDILAHIMGQRLIIFSLAFVPIALYCYYKYTKSYLENNPQTIYLILSVMLASLGSLFHPQMLGIIFASLSLYTIFLIIKYRRLPFSMKWLFVCIIIATIIILPFAPDWFTQKQANPGTIGIKNLGSLFSWSSDDFGVFGSWIIPFIIVCIIFLLISHKDNDMLILCWLIGLYLMLHLNVIGIYESRVNRFLYGSAHIFYPMLAILCYHISNLTIKYKQYLKWGLFAILVMAMILTQGIIAYNTLSTAYPPIMRMTDSQYAAAQWIDQNLPEDAIVYTIGSLTYPKQRWMNMFSHRSFEVNHPQEGNGILYPNATHILVDFSDTIKINNQDYVNLLSGWIQYQNLSNKTPIYYNKEGIVVYEH